MHLNDQQLLEPNDIEKQHIQSCRKCANRQQVVNQFRQKLKSLPELPSQNNQWQLIKESNQKVANIKQPQKTQRMPKARWQVGIAASFLGLIIFWFFSTGFSTGEQERLIQKMVNQNNILQQKLIQQERAEKNNRTESIKLQLKISAIDKALQQAYIQQQDPLSKIELWKKRQRLLEQSLAQNTSVKKVKI